MREIKQTLSEKELKELKRLLRYINKRNVEIAEVKKRFDELIEKKYSAHYSDIDEDYIIDLVDYGNGLISFKKFDFLMKAKIKSKKR